MTPGAYKLAYRHIALSRYQCFVYACEGFPEFTDILRELFEAIDAGNITAVTSELTLAELLVKPFMDGDPHRQEVYRDTIRNSDLLSVHPVSREILMEAA